MNAIDSAMIEGILAALMPMPWRSSRVSRAAAGSVRNRQRVCFGPEPDVCFRPNRTSDIAHVEGDRMVLVWPLLLLIYIVILLRLFPILDRVYVPDENDLWSNASQKTIVALGMPMSFLAQVAVVWVIATLVRGGENQGFLGFSTALITPPVLGMLVAGFAKSEIDRRGANRSRLAMNWLGVGSLHGTWANPLATFALAAFI